MNSDPLALFDPLDHFLQKLWILLLLASLTNIIQRLHPISLFCHPTKVDCLVCVSGFLKLAVLFMFACFFQILYDKKFLFSVLQKFIVTFFMGLVNFLYNHFRKFLTELIMDGVMVEGIFFVEKPFIKINDDFFVLPGFFE